MTDIKPDLRTVQADVRAGIDELTGALQKAATSLLVAHGGAMLACLSQLKDYSTNPQLKHIGFVIAAFASGFLLALLAYIDVAVWRAKLMVAVFKADAESVKEIPARAIAFLYVSAGVLALIVLGVAWWFFWL